MAQGHAPVNTVMCPWLGSPDDELNLGCWGLGSIRL